MKIEKCVLSGALRVLEKVVCQRSPVEKYRSIRFRGGENGVKFLRLTIANDKMIRRLTSYHLEVTEPDTIRYIIPLVSEIKIFIIFLFFISYNYSCTKFFSNLIIRGQGSKIVSA